MELEYRMFEDLMPISNAATKRAEHFDFNGQRCLIENCSNSGAVELVHVFSRDSETHLVEGLEWHWGMKQSSLNLDSRQNIFFLGASMHQLYRERKWALVPEQQFVSKYFSPAGIPLKRNKFPHIDGDVFRYKFLPVYDLDDIYIARQDTDTGHVVVHNYPFEDLPIVTSHIHPKYAIIHLGGLLFSPLVPTRTALVKRYPWFADVLELFLWWTSRVPEVARDNPTYISPGPSNESSEYSDSGVNTPQKRIRAIPSADVHRAADSDCFIPGVGKRKLPPADDADDHGWQKKRLLTSDILEDHDDECDDVDSFTRISHWLHSSLLPSAPRKAPLRRSTRIQVMTRRKR